MDMIKRVLKKKEGFTLVELIVVLVILAILAAILVPTLTGYINQANTEKNYSTAQTVRVAAQSVASDVAGRKTNKGANFTVANGNETQTNFNKTKANQSVTDLAGVDSKVSAYSFHFDKDGKLQTTETNTVTIDGSTYTLGSDGSWSAAPASSSSSNS